MAQAMNTESRTGMLLFVIGIVNMFAGTYLAASIYLLLGGALALLPRLPVADTSRKYIAYAVTVVACALMGYQIMTDLLLL